MVRIRGWFPEREFIMRTEGHVRYVRISSRLQLTVAAIVAGLLLAWVLTMAAVAIGSWLERRDSIALLNREAQVSSAESRIAAYRKNVDDVAGDLARRQTFIEEMVKTHVGDLPTAAKAGETVSDSSAEASRTVDKVSLVIPEAASLARVEADQLAFAERLTRFADRKSAAAEAALRKLGLNPKRMLASLEDRGAIERKESRFTCDIDELDLAAAEASRVAFSHSKTRSLTLGRASLTHVDLRDLEIGEVAGLDGLRGATLSPLQSIELAPAMAAELGLKIES